MYHGTEDIKRDGLLGHPFNFAPGIRGGCLPFGEARGWVFALSELPHPYHDLLLDAKIGIVLNSTNKEMPGQARHDEKDKIGMTYCCDYSLSLHKSSLFLSSKP